jgi:hypothetical protein
MRRINLGWGEIVEWSLMMMIMILVWLIMEIMKVFLRAVLKIHNKRLLVLNKAQR